MGICWQQPFNLVLLGSLLLAGCGQLNTRQLAADIETEIEGQGYRISLQSVQCPDGITQQEGVVFFCVGTVTTDVDFNIEVQQIDNDGNVEWTVDSTRIILNLADLEAELEAGLAQDVGTRSPVDCGYAYRLNQPNVSFECNVVGDPLQGQERITAILVTVDGQGNVQWEEIRHIQGVLEKTADNVE
ncbi:MAG: DUF4333 domain-containing protein [Cyanobacteria bacterium P01_D01_bin.128]